MAFPHSAAFPFSLLHVLPTSSVASIALCARASTVSGARLWIRLGSHVLSLAPTPSGPVGVGSSGTWSFSGVVSLFASASSDLAPVCASHRLIPRFPAASRHESLPIQRIAEPCAAANCSGASHWLLPPPSPPATFPQPVRRASAVAELGVVRRLARTTWKSRLIQIFFNYCWRRDHLDSWSRPLSLPARSGSSFLAFEAASDRSQRTSDVISPFFLPDLFLPFFTLP